MNNNLTGQYIQGVHKCDNTPLGGDWTIKDNRNHGLFLEDIRHLLTKDRLVRLNHKIIASQPMDSKEKYKKCNIKLPCIVAKNVKNPKKLPYRLIEGSHRMQKMKDNNIKNSMFYTISESEFYDNLTEGAIKKPNHIEVIEDVLPRENMKNIQSWMHSPTFSWIYNPDNLYDSKREENPNPDFRPEIRNRFLFNHTWIWEGELRKDSCGRDAIIDLGILIDKVIEASGTHLIKRIKANLYTNRGRKVKYGEHTDMPESNDFYWTLIYHVNNCNGITVLDDKEKNIYKEIKQKENQLIMFDGRIRHYGIAQDDADTRIVINFLLI